MQLIQRRGGAQLATLLSRFGIGGTAPDAGVEDVVQPVAEVPRVDDLCGGSAEIAGASLDRSLVQLFNPANSGVTAILHRAWISIETASVVTLRIGDTALADAVTGVAVLSRTRGNQPQPSCQMRSLNGNSIGTANLRWHCPVHADGPLPIDFTRLGSTWELPGLALAEGRGVIFTPATDDLDFTCALLWSERIIPVL